MAIFNSNSTLTLVFNLVATAAKLWIQSKGQWVNPLVEEWVRHYFFGEGVEKTLPTRAVEETKEAVKSSLRLLWMRPSWRIHTARVGKFLGKNSQGERGMESWFCSLNGVVGSFNYNLIPEETGVTVKCWDLWDFNTNSKECMELKVPSTLHKPIKSLAKMLSINVEEHEELLRVSEVELATLNKGRQFYTKWEFFLTWEELGVTDPTQYKWEHGGLPIDWFIENTP
jgi:hypothetical protein